MNRYNLPHEVNLLIVRFKVKTNSDEYIALTEKLEALKQTNWFILLSQLRLIKDYIILYQTEAENSNLQSIIDEITTINWFNYLSSANKIKRAIELIETI